jgi:hypothetical protein
MAKKDNAPFGDVAASPDSVPMATQGVQRSTTNEAQGKIRRDIARTPTAAGNPYKPGSSAWDGHDQTLGF